jgi:hypothetical protein
VYLFYVDESGNTGARLDAPDQPIHWLVALAVKPAVVQKLESELLAIALRYRSQRARHPTFEFHGASIFQGEGDFAGMPPVDRIRLYRDLLETLKRHDVPLFCRGIHKAHLQERAAARGYDPEHPHVLGFMYLAEELDRWLQRLQPKQELFEDPAPPVLGLIVADEQREVGRKLVGRFSWWRQFGTDHGYKTREIRYLVDTVHYVPSQDSWLIQLADCVAYLVNRYQRTREQKGFDIGSYTASEKAVAKLWEDCCSPVEHWRIWPE